jgi:DNA mismatch endonuclease (patch repair protein)
MARSDKHLNAEVSSSLDIVDPKRSALMARIKTRDTSAELRVRSILHRMGLRFRLHIKHLPGTPDIVLARYSTVVFVHGCFWHGHHCRRGSLPKSNAEFWANKIGKNKHRDNKVKRELAKLGWRAINVWECELRNEPKLVARLGRIFNVCL